jgi:hypothetical protein
MPLLRTFAFLLSVMTLAIGTSACGGDNDGPATTTTGVGPQEVEEPGERENVPGDPDAPATNPGGAND